MTRTERAVRGGGLVAVNHVAGVGISVITALCLSRMMGPSIFAVFAICGSLSAVTRVISRLGINAYLLTRPEKPAEKDYHVALAAMLAASIAIGSSVILLLPGMARFGHISHLVGPGVATMVLLPLHVLSLPARTRLERDLQFKPLIIIELTAQVMGSGLGIALAWGGWGIWGIITGWGARDVLTAVVPWIVIQMRPRLAWDSSAAWRMLGFGFKYMVAHGIDNGRNLVVLFIVGRLIGQEGVGHIELTLRAVRFISPIRAAAGRVALPALAPIAAIPGILKRAVDTLVETELILSVPVTVLAVWAYPVCVQHFLGPEWHPTIPIFPWMASAALLASVHATCLHVLHIRGYFWESIFSTGFNLLCLALLMLVCGRIAGLEGCAAAGVAVWPAFWIREWLAAKRLGTQWSRNGVVWALGGASACLAANYGVRCLIPLLLIVLWTVPAIMVRLRALIRS